MHRRTALPVLATSLVATALTVGCALSKKDTEKLPLCVAKTVESDTLEVQERSLEPIAWFNVLLVDWNRETGLTPQPVQDCMRRDVQWSMPASCPVAPMAEMTPPRELIAEDVIVAKLDDKHDLVWIVSRRHIDGSGTGPVALVEWLPNGIAVRALGPLHAPAEAPRMRLEPLGPPPEQREPGDGLPDLEMLVVESERCVPPPPDPYDLMHPPEPSGEDAAADGAPPPAPPRCQPVTTLVPIVDGIITPTPLSTEEGQCLGEARFSNLDAIEVDLTEGWVRRFDLVVELTYGDGTVTVREQVRVSDRDPSTPNVPPRPYRTVDDVRSIEFVDGQLVTPRLGLFERVLARDARVNGMPVPPSERRKVALPRPQPKAPAQEEGGDAPPAPKAGEDGAEPSGGDGASPPKAPGAEAPAKPEAGPPSGPELSGPELSGPELSGPELSGPGG